MRDKEDKTPQTDRLDGWGEIAAYLRRDVRTVQRWEKQEGLPVHRHPGPRPRVWALRGELDQWWEIRAAELAPEEVAGPDATETDRQPKRRFTRRTRVLVSLLAGAAILLGALAALWVNRNRDVVVLHTVPDRIFARVGSEGGHVEFIPVGGLPLGIVLSPDRRHLYVLENRAVPELRIIDLDRRSVTRTVEIAGKPTSVRFSPDGETIYVGTLHDGLYQLNRRHEITRVIRTNITGKVTDLAVTPDGKRVFLALEHAGLREYDVTTGRVRAIHSVTCPQSLVIDAPGRHLFVGAQCGGSGGSIAHDSVDVFDVATTSPAGTLRGPPMVAGALYLLPDGARIWVNGLDACSPHYQKYGLEGCPYVPGNISHVFRLADGRLVRTLGAASDAPMGDPAFTPAGDRAVVGGTPLRVFDTQVFDTLETFSPEKEASGTPVIDLKRRRIYVSATAAGHVYVFDLPPSDCNVPASGLIHYWPGDGALSDWRLRVPLNGEAVFRSGLIGRAFAVQRDPLTVTSPNPSFDAGTMRDGSIQAWVKLTGAGGGTLFAFDEDRMPYWSVRVLPTGHVLFSMADVRTTETSTPLKRGAWHHIAVIRRGSTVELYVDAARVLQVTRAPFAPNVRTKTLRVGPMAGLVDELAMYERPLHERELREIMRLPDKCLGTQP